MDSKWLLEQVADEIRIQTGAIYYGDAYAQTCYTAIYTKCKPGDARLADPFNCDFNRLLSQMPNSGPGLYARTKYSLWLLAPSYSDDWRSGEFGIGLLQEFSNYDSNVWRYLAELSNPKCLDGLVNALEAAEIITSSDTTVPAAMMPDDVRRPLRLGT